MASVHAVYAWLLGRAFIYIAVLSALLWWGTRNNRVVGSYAAAHALALLGGAALDFAIYKLALHSQPTMHFLEWIYAAPIFLFGGISLYLCGEVAPLHLADVLLPVAAIVAWGLAVIFGPQNMDGYDVLGAWFVAAGVGAIDLFSLHGPAEARSRKYLTRAAGYAATVALTYLGLPRT